ncbi:MAG: DNA repair protein RecO [Bacteroidales bacterium]|nr:DNA repair protein RecO [Bacteroidales bacterium]
MFVTSKAIVLHKTKYADSGIVVKVFTERYGTQTFIIKNAFSAKNKHLLPLFAPLSMIELQFDDRKLNQLMYLKEATCYYQYADIPFNIVKSSLLMFYSELLYKLLYEYGEDRQLFAFVEQRMRQLDDAVTVRPDTHIDFMLRMSQILGFYPVANYDTSHTIFSILHSSFVSHWVDEEQSLSPEASRLLFAMMEEELPPVAPKALRNELLYGMLRYYKRNNEHIGKIESVSILADILKE